jgi:hypothetical protein
MLELRVLCQTDGRLVQTAPVNSVYLTPRRQPCGPTRKFREHLKCAQIIAGYRSLCSFTFRCCFILIYLQHKFDFRTR